jgi:sugar phosphate isomerase/epimerase
MASDYIIENIYQGGYSSLKPNHGDIFSGYRTSSEKLGTPSAPPGEQGNLMANLSKSVATGQKAVELSLLNSEAIDAIPKQHLEDTKRIAELAGVSLSIHGPLVDASGASERGYDKQQRETAERQIFNALERSNKLDSKGNISVTFHTTNGAPGTIWKKEKGEAREYLMPIVNQETGQITAAIEEERFIPGRVNEKGEVEGIPFNAQDSLEMKNNTEWSDSLDKVEFNRENAERIMRDVHPILIAKFTQIREKQSKGEQINSNDISPEEYEEIKKVYSADAYLGEARRTASSLFDQAYKYGTKEEKEYLTRLSQEYGMTVQKAGLNPTIQSQALFELRRNLEKVKPEIWKSAEEYTIQEGTKSFGNAAWKAYKEFGDKSPILNIENPPAGMGASRADNVKEMVEGSRKQFVENAMKDGMSKPQAEKNAEKLIGATWDVGHINQLRKFGFSGEDIIKEAEKIAPYVKHVHLSDNFGAENTELPPGMGNVDFEGQMKKLGKRGEDATKIVEAFHWVQGMKSSPYGVSLQALGSPIYSMQMGPYWNQVAGLEQGYFGGYGNTFPQINYETFGGSFSHLPVELGGQRPGAQGGRISGTPME